MMNKININYSNIIILFSLITSFSIINPFIVLIYFIYLKIHIRIYGLSIY